MGALKKAISLRAKHKNPKGGLTEAGRKAYNRATGSNLKPGVKGAANTPEKMRRKGSFLTRMFSDPKGGAVKNGKPTRRALSAAAWGEAVPKTTGGMLALAAKGRRMLARYKAMKGSK
jgi:hypothetical protein